MQWFNRFSIKSRLIASFLVLFALLATVVGVAWLNNARSQVAVKGIVEQDMVGLLAMTLGSPAALSMR